MHPIQNIYSKLWLKRLLIVALIPLLCGGMLYLFRIQLLIGLAAYLTVDDPLDTADVIFILNGDKNSRPFQAAKLYERGLAPRIVIAREKEPPAVEIGSLRNGTDVTIDIMKELGVPEAAITEIVIDGGVTSTYDEAVVFDRYAKEHDLERAILVTSAFHTRRAQWIFERTWDGPTHLLVSAAPQWGYTETNWWQTERGLIMVVNEYIKFGYYLARY